VRDDSKPADLRRVRISAVIPTYNRGHLISRTIESALAQTFPPVEVILVDDGSTDDTSSVVTKFGDKVRYVHQVNAGASAARNHGVSVATGEWIAFLDSDDVWIETHLLRMAEAIVATGGTASFYFADMERPKESGGGSHWKNCGFSMQGKIELTNDASEWVMLDWQPMMLQNSVFNKSKFISAGGLMNELRTRHDNHVFLKLGIGGTACAVAGYGTRQTYDADPVHHLMSSWGSHTSDFWKNTVLLYEDILSSVRSIRPNHQRIIRRRLAEAYWRLSRFASRNKDVFPALRFVGKILTTYPFYFIEALTRENP